ncbi:MAG: C39 family peptidase [Nanoarchaeota archaeon]|nr:C39 family peptidase [Nanoarchaeota archaeon]
MAQIPFYKQETNYTCGAASMRMALEFCGIKKSEKQVAKLLGTNKVRGTWHKNFPIIAEKFRLNHMSMRKATINDLQEYQKKGFIIIICYFYPQEKFDHYSVLKRIDDKYIYFYDPFFGENHNYLLTYFKKIWKSDLQYDNEKCWFFAVKK